MRHRQKYANDIDGFSVTDKSPIRNGLVTDRQCTDAFCAIALVVCALGFFGVAGYALSQGNPERLFSGVDGQGRVCGQSGQGTGAYPYLLVVPYAQEGAISEQDEYRKAVCVKSCPAKDTSSDCLFTKETACSDFAGAGISTKRLLQYCLPSEAVSDANKSVD